MTSSGRPWHLALAASGMVLAVWVAAHAGCSGGETGAPLAEPSADASVEAKDAPFSDRTWEPPLDSRPEAEAGELRWTDDQEGWVKAEVEKMVRYRK